jgi:hypothetical protein
VQGRWFSGKRPFSCKALLNLGGSLDTEPDTQSPFFDPDASSASAAQGGQACVFYGAAEFSRDGGTAITSAFRSFKAFSSLARFSGLASMARSRDSADDDNKYEWGSTDALGRFSLQGFVGAEYWVHGESNSSGKGEPIKIKVQTINQPLKVVIPFPKRMER